MKKRHTQNIKLTRLWLPRRRGKSMDGLPFASRHRGTARLLPREIQQKLEEAAPQIQRQVKRPHLALQYGRMDGFGVTPLPPKRVFPLTSLFNRPEKVPLPNQTAHREGGQWLQFCQPCPTLMLVRAALSSWLSSSCRAHFKTS